MATALSTDHPILSREDWTERAQAHRARITEAIGPYLAARRRGEKHPVIDFLFTYYSARPIQVLRWHPGYGIALDGAPEYAELQDYLAVDEGRVIVDPELPARRENLIAAITALTRATAERPARLGCFGLHEWAMVYRTDDIRHPLPLRLGPAGTDAVVESLPLRCTHYDAFRFFTEPARPRNAAQLTRETQLDHEQPGCLHAAMDLYRFCLKLSPLVDGELLADSFLLALRARTLDMRASPYDLSALGYSAVPIETAAGRAEYLREQTEIATAGYTVRERIAEVCAGLHRRPPG